MSKASGPRSAHGRAWACIVTEHVTVTPWLSTVLPVLTWPGAAWQALQRDTAELCDWTSEHHLSPR